MNIKIVFKGIICILLSILKINAQEVSFTHGVASGDPNQESVVLWTRAISSDSSDVKLDWKIAIDRQLKSIVKTGQVKALKTNDFCVKVIADGLKPGMTYYYQFDSQGFSSSIGRTNTLPAESEEIKIGVANCAKYTGGYYHAYEEIAKMDDLDVVIHLGDYIYENDASKPGSSYWPAYLATGRQHDPPYECLSLSDYRRRYAQYHSDTSLIKLHEKYPMINIWDDHEIAMKSLKKLPDGTLQYNGDWEGRLKNSLKAYYEWLPIRTKLGEPIYRSFQFGNLVNLLMLDTRVCCKSKVTKTTASLKDSSRHIIGNEQLNWIKNEVLGQNCTWNIFGNQLLISLKGNGWERWQGFPRDRDRMLQFMQTEKDRNFLFVTGNAHNPHHYIVMDHEKKDTLTHEMLPGSISSGNNAEKAFFDPKILAKEEKRLKNADNVLWFNQNSHGFIVLEISREALNTKWYFVSTIREKNYSLSIPYQYRILAKDRF